jgi:hypothetical protein
MYKNNGIDFTTGLPRPSVNKITNDGTIISIPFAPDNTDYQTFKAQINADEAQLEDADGNVMSAEEAKAYVANLP